MTYQSPTFKKAANPVAFSAGTWYNNNNKDSGKIAETSRGENMKHKPLPIGVEDFKRNRERFRSFRDKSITDNRSDRCSCNHRRSWILHDKEEEVI